LKLSPNLSVYPGRLNPTSTCWYLTATLETLPAASQFFENYAEGGKQS